MTTPPAIPQTRTNNLALAFQDVITVILRMRSGFNASQMRPGFARAFAR